MRGPQAWEPHMGKNNSSTSSSVSPSLPRSFSPCKPLLVGEEINSRLVCLRLQEFVVVVECVCVCVCMRFCVCCVFFSFSAVGGRMRSFEVYPAPQGRRKILSLPPYFPTLSSPSVKFHLRWHLFSDPSLLCSSSLPSTSLYPLPFQFCFSFRGVCK